MSRQPEPLGPQYRGSRIGRDELVNGESASDGDAGRRDFWDEDEDDVVNEDEDEKEDENLLDQEDLDLWGIRGSEAPKDEDDDEDKNDLDQEDLDLLDLGANEIRHGMGKEMDESDQTDNSEAIREADHEKHESCSLNGRMPSGLPSKKDMIEMEDVDSFGASGEISDGENKDRVSIEGGAVDADTRYKYDDDDRFTDEMAGMNETDRSSDESSSQHESGSSISSEPEPEPKFMDERATLRQMMAESQKTVVATIAEASKVDVAKGEAIAHQRTTFDALLNARIHLQKGVIAMNSLSTHDTPTLTDDTMTSVISSAEAAALKLWNGLQELRQAMQPCPPPTKKRLVVSPATHSTTTAAMWDRMQGHEAQFIPTRRATLTKWSSRLRPLAVDRDRATLSGNSDIAPLMTVLDQQLAAPNRARLVARTRVPRSGAPVQAAAQIPSDPEIYDDADFYATLLRELVDRRMTDSSLGRVSGGSGRAFNHDDPSNPVASSSASLLPRLAHDRKPRGQVDTRASKGRKMRYAVHEKLQNFMAPEDRGSWGERQTTELFAGLLGRKRVALGEEEEENEDDGMPDMKSGYNGVSVNGHVLAATRTNGHSTETIKSKNMNEEEALMMFRQRR